MTRLGNPFSDKLVGATAWLFAGFAATGLFNYGFQVAMGRLLTPAEFGFMNALLGVLVVLSVPVSTLIMVLAKKTAEFCAAKNPAAVTALYRRASKRVFLAGTAGLAVFILGSGFLAEYLHSPSRVPVLILGLCIFSAVVLPVNMAVLQGVQDYKWLGFIQGLTGPLKFIFCVALALMGLGVNGALAGMFLANWALWALAYLPLRRHLKDEAGGPAGGFGSYSQVLPAFLTNLAFAVLTQADLILVNRYFSGQEAAMYASAAVLGRTVMYIPATLVLAMYPMASEQQALSQDTAPLFFKSLLITLLLSGLGALIFYLAPGFVMGLLFGSRYADGAGLLKYFGAAMLPMALLTVLSHYLVARGKTAFSYIMVLGAALEVILIRQFHGSPAGIILIVACVGLLLVTAGMVQVRLAKAPASEFYVYECA